MGQAKRRSQKDPNFGKIHQLRSGDDIRRHGKPIFLELYATFRDDIEEILENPDTARPEGEITEWLENRLSKYNGVGKDAILAYLACAVTKASKIFSARTNNPSVIDPAFIHLFISVCNCLSEEERAIIAEEFLKQGFEAGKLLNVKQ